MEPVVWDTAPKPKTCEKCGQLFPSHGAFYAHRKTCRETFPCGQCAERLGSKGELKAHLKLHSHGHLTCGLCDRPPFRSQFALDHHRHEEHGVELKCACGKAYSSADHLKRHMKACVATGPSLVCNCGAALQDMEKFREHQEGCVISPPGATKAVKRRFSEIIGDASGEDREAAALQAFNEVAQVVRAKLAVTCASCGKGYVNASKLRRHRFAVGH